MEEDFKVEIYDVAFPKKIESALIHWYFNDYIVMHVTSLSDGRVLIIYRRVEPAALA